MSPETQSLLGEGTFHIIGKVIGSGKKMSADLGNVAPYAGLCRSGVQPDGFKYTRWTLRQMLMQHSQTSVCGGHV